MDDRLLLTVTTADGAGLLSELARREIPVLGAEEPEALQLRLVVKVRDRSRVLELLDKRGAKVLSHRRMGLRQRLGRVFSHPVLLLGVLLLVVLTAWLPTRILFIQVRGNGDIPEKQILEAADRAGLAFFANRGDLRSEKVKNALLEELPRLQWAGVNTQGCLAVITVRERSTGSGPEQTPPGSMVALRDALVRSVTVTRGTALCTRGQTVRQGEVLISGYTDCGGIHLLCTAQGEVYGETLHQIRAATPVQTLQRGALLRTETKFSVIFGKNQIFFYEDSGILDSGCVKMYSEYWLTLPGGFRLPVMLLRETWLYYDTAPGELNDWQCSQLLQACGRDYLLEQMVAGQILEQSALCREGEMIADYICLEMIGQIRYEEYTESYGENYGKNR